MAKIENTDNVQCPQGCEGIRMHMPWGGMWTDSSTMEMFVSIHWVNYMCVWEPSNSTIPKMSIYGYQKIFMVTNQMSIDDENKW